MIVSNSTRYFLLYTLVSVASLSWSVYDSLTKAVNYITFITEFTDGIKLGILINFLFMTFVSLSKLFQFLLFGELRIIEVEHLTESLPIFLINLLFNLTMNDNNLIFNCLLLAMAISSKAFHIILIDRLDFLNLKISGSISEENFTRSVIILRYLLNLNVWLILFSTIIDFALAKFLVYDVFQGINTVTCLLFGFQFAVQAVETLTYFSKMILTVLEYLMFKVNNEDEDDGNFDSVEDEDEGFERVWENKPYYSKSIDILSALLKAVSYLAFIYLLTFHSGLSLPISMLQGTYSSIRQAYVEIKQLLAFIESSKRLDSQLPTATRDILSNGDNLCIICRDDMYSVEDYEVQFHKKMPPRKYPKILKCNHILHMGCLKDWLERSEACPLCRRDVFGQDSTTAQTPNNTNNDPGFFQPEEGTRNVENNINDINNNDNGNDDNNTNTNTNTNTNEINENNTNLREGITNVETNTDTTRVINEGTRNGVLPTPTLAVNNQNGASQNEISQNGTTPNGYQYLRLPNTAILPPNWTILPVDKVSGNLYRVHLSNEVKGTLEIKEAPLGGQLRFIQPQTNSNNQEANGERELS